MKLLPKCHQKPGRPVTSWAEIKDDAFAMLELLNQGGFVGRWKEGFALSHAQVSENPYNFFVTHKSWQDTLPRVVCNAKITQGVDLQTFKEACLSYPFRNEVKTRRFWRLEVEFDVPPIDGIKALLGVNRLTHSEMVVDGMAAYLFQHEIDHAKGIDIYHK